MERYRITKNLEGVKEISRLANVIWPITYKDILSKEQIAYMLKMFLSEEAVTENILNDYNYELILDNNKPVGFMAYEIRLDYLFLSKLYLLPEAQNKHLATESIKYLKTYHLPIELTVNIHNENAFRKYLHLGFEVFATVISQIGQGYVMDDYKMRLNNK